MRLLQLEDDGKLSLTKDLVSHSLPYAILSHTWGDDDEEVTFQDITENTGTDKAGYRKIEFCGQQAASNGLRHFWVDTCCIDKSNNSELSTAINSMFKWYQKATRCYVYLSDVSKDDCSRNDDLLRSTWKSAFRKSRWFTRGWTLQELIAPSSVEFFSIEGQRLGDRNSLEPLLHEITKIAIGALRGRDLSDFTIHERMSWSYGRETNREEDRAYSLLGIFKVYLSLIYGEGVDNAFIRLQDEISKRSAISAKKPVPVVVPTHERLRYLPTTDPCDNNESTTLTQVEASIPEIAEMQEQLLDLLYFEEIDARLLTLKAAHNKTCQWFLHTKQYKVWKSAETLHDHRGFLWVKGKPGAGKSTLMKFLDSEAKKAARSNPNALVISFFFNARGGVLEKATTGLYRSLLWQLFKKAEDLQEILGELDANAQYIFQRNGWQLEILKQTLAKAVERLGCRSLYIFIDALDECHDDDVTDMISFFEDLGERAVEANVRLRICFSSRHYPTIIIRWGTQLVLEDEEDHGADITRYITSKLNLANSSKADGLRFQILEKSAGVFLWVALVIPMLNKACAKGRIDELQKCLDGIPPELDNLFEMILTRDREDMEEFRLCVQWILFAKRPLKLAEYYSVICGPNNPETIRSWISGDISPEFMHRFAHSSSKGLAEVTKTRSKDKAPTVQFIHESVRTFFLANGGYQKLWPDFDGRFVAYSHRVLQDRCLSEINASIGSSTFTILVQTSTQPLLDASSQIKSDFSKYVPPYKSLLEDSSEASTLRQSVSEEHQFLEYAVHHVLYHADAAENDIIRQEVFLKEFPRKDWIFLDNLFERYKIRRHTSNASLLYILAEKNLPRLIKHELRRVSNMDIQGERYHFPMFAACANGNQEAIMALLEQETQPQNNSDLASELSFLFKLKPQRLMPISYAATKGHWEFVSLLLGTGKVNTDPIDGIGRTPLSYAAENGHEGVVRLLLETGTVDADSKDKHGLTPLSYAAENGHEGVVKLLFEIGTVDTGSKYKGGRTPLSYAAENGHEGVVKLLLEIGIVDADSKDKHGLTPLSYAAENGHEGVVKLLLEIGIVDADSKDKHGLTPLSYAAENGHEGVIKLLLEIGIVDADSKSIWDDNRTPLLYAAMNGHEGVVKLLLGTGKVNTDPIDGIGRTPLLYAAENGHEGVVKLLLETGTVDADSKNKYSLTPLLYAAINGHEGVVKLLLGTGKVNTNPIDGIGRTPLSYAAENGHEGVVKLLLETGTVDADSKNKHGLTPRSYAAMNGHEGIIRLLLDTGKVDARSEGSMFS